MVVDVTAWRKERRADLIARRQAVDPTERRSWGTALETHLRGFLAGQAPATIGFYWPFRAEFDARPLIRDLLAQGWRAALPVVIVKKAPMEFRLWTPDAPMVDGIWNIPVPRDGAPVRPDVVLAPLVGFDRERYRLGYGGGYFDRTLATLAPRPLVIGVGFEFSRLETIYPQPFDQPMTMIVTEAGIQP
jgi:5-formyltetrahydrofolate cyclo-ligase